MMWKMLRFFVLLGLLIIFANAALASVFNRTADTLLNRKSSTGYISLQILNKPHHLFIGRCKPEDEVIHEETIILNNDGKSQIGGTVQVNVEGEVYITCVKILDQVPGGGGYPSYVGGGVGQNHVLFNVTTDYGKGFNFFVQINGYDLDEEATQVL